MFLEKHKSQDFTSKGRA